MKKYVIFSALIIVLTIVIFNNKIVLRQKNNNKKHNITYKIIKSDSYNSEYATRGYYINQTDEKTVLITIASGMKNTGGYDINIENIKVDNKNVKIEVKEKEPQNNSIVNQVIKYPIVQVELSEMPKSLIIKNIDNNSSYKKINN